MKITRSFISIGSVILLGLLTATVFQKGVSTIQSMTTDAKMPNDSEIITMNTINTLEKQVQQLSQQQNNLIQDMEKLHFKLQANAFNCVPLNLPERNTDI